MAQTTNNSKKVDQDIFMAASVGDLDWLKQSTKMAKGTFDVDENGFSPLHLAAVHGRLECVKYLVDTCKIDPNTPSLNGWQPIHLCISNQTGKRSIECLQYLYKKGCSLECVTEDGVTPLHQAASEGHVQCLKFLLEKGAKVDKYDVRGNTPLDLAKLWGHRKCARVLASEKWHQNKAQVAKQLQELTKYKMQQVLLEIEYDIEHHNLGYKMWKESQGHHITTGTGTASHRRGKIETPESPTENQRSKTKLKKLRETKLRSKNISRNNDIDHPIKSALKPVGFPRRRYQTVEHKFSQESQENRQLNESRETASDGEYSAGEIYSSSSRPYHQYDWNFSTKLQAKPYITNLKGEIFTQV